jgi:hypothetical protein
VEVFGQPTYRLLAGLKSTLKLSCGRRSVGQSVLVSDHHLGTATNFSSSSLQIPLGYLWVLLLGALSEERVSL